MYVRWCKDRNSCAQTRNAKDGTRMKTGTQDINMENPKIGKNHGGPQTPRNRITMMRGITIRDSEAMTLSSSSSTDGGRVTNSYTLTLSLTQLQRQQLSLTILQR